MAAIRSKKRQLEKTVAAEGGGERSIGARLHELRKAAGVTQEAIGAEGFVSTPGWIKIEHGQRSPSEKLLGQFVTWLVEQKVIRASQQTTLLTELTALTYAGHNSPFLRRLASAYMVDANPTKLQSN